MTVRDFIIASGVQFTNNDVRLIAEECKRVAVEKNIRHPKKKVIESGFEVMARDYPKNFMETMADICIKHFTGNGRV